MEEKLNGIVISAISIGENDKLLNIFTLEKGVVCAKIKGVKKPNAKLKFAAEPFCFAEYTLAVRGEYRTVTGASLTDSFYPLRSDIFRFYCGGCVLEYIKKFLHEEMVSVDIFLLAVKTLEQLAYTEEVSQSVLVRFLINALKMSGYALNLSGCTVCQKEPQGRVFFDYSRGAFFCEDCFDNVGREINANTFLALEKAREEMALSQRESTMCLKLLDYYIKTKAEENIVSLTELLKISN